MSRSNVTFSRNQRRALAAILANGSISAAAAACKLSEKTLSRYLAEPGFRQALSEAEGETINAAGRRLLAGQDLALDTLQDLMTTAARESDRLRAAAAWTDFMFRFRELRNIESRLADLESQVYGNRK